MHWDLQSIAKAIRFNALAATMAHETYRNSFFLLNDLWDSLHTAKLDLDNNNHLQ